MREGPAPPVALRRSSGVAGRETPDVHSSTGEYAGRFSGSVGAWFLDVQERAVGELLSGLPPGARILDVGGGHAQLVPSLVEAGHRVVVLGSEPSCAQRLSPWLAGGRCTFEVGDLTDLPHPDGSFDVALSFRILPHLRRWRELVRELCRVSRRGVVVDYASTRSVNRLSEALYGLKRHVEGNTRPFALFRPSEVEEAFRACGFEVTATRAQYLLPMALHRMTGSAVLARAVEAPGRALGLTRRFGSPVIALAEPMSSAYERPLESTSHSRPNW